jgi:hypothetical protein
LLHGAADLYAHVRPDVVEAPERLHRRVDKCLQSGRICRIDAERRGAELGCECIDPGSVDIAQGEAVAARGQQPGSGVSDPSRTAKNERPHRHTPGF